MDRNRLHTAILAFVIAGQSLMMASLDWQVGVVSAKEPAKTGEIDPQLNLRADAHECGFCDAIE